MEKMFNTNLEMKKKHLATFVGLIENQLNHGGDKYRQEGDEQKEQTDAICEFVPGQTGVDWILGTIYKYLGRFKNTNREKDILKIATYCYLVWLKKGFHEKQTHDEDTKVEG
jgi:hypothetical protein